MRQKIRSRCLLLVPHPIQHFITRHLMIRCLHHRLPGKFRSIYCAYRFTHLVLIFRSHKRKSNTTKASSSSSSLSSSSSQRRYLPWSIPRFYEQPLDPNGNLKDVRSWSESLLSQIREAHCFNFTSFHWLSLLKKLRAGLKRKLVSPACAITLLMPLDLETFLFLQSQSFSTTTYPPACHIYIP